MRSVVARARSLWRGIRRREQLDAEMSDEFRLHVELRAEDLLRGGVSLAEARRQARIEFGSADHYKDVGAESRGLRRFDGLRVSWLDFKLGFRMLARYPGLTIVGSIAMAFAIAVGAAGFELIGIMLRPTVPLDEGDRIVALTLWDAANRRSESRLLHDLDVWRSELRTVEQVSAFRTVDRNLITEIGGRGEPVVVAEMSASAFPLARVRPLLGRTVTEADELPGAASVAVIGWDVWQSRFGGDANILGRTARLGNTSVTIVGVMPAGYRFPAFHSVWTPLRLRGADYPQGLGPGISRAFARLKPGVSISEAQGELKTIGARHAAELPSTHAQLRPEVVPYARSFLQMNGTERLAISSVNFFLVMLMVLVCGNVALLMFARAASRESEIVVRTALGASRARIITQLFAEALVLGGVALVIGLTIAAVSHRLEMTILAADANRRWPFWFKDSLSPETVFYAIGLTLLGAAVAGVLPALKVTRGLDARLRQAAAGVSGPQFGGVWTVLIVAQIAVTVAFPVAAFFTRRDAAQIEALDLGLPSREFLTANVVMDREVASPSGVDTSEAGYRARFRATSLELERRLEAHPSVAGVTFATLLPSMNHPQRDVEIQGDADTTRRSASVASVAVDYFQVASVRPLAGRGFLERDLTSDVKPIVVNQSFVIDVLGGRNAIGRRVRFVSDAKRSGSITSPPMAREGARNIRATSGQPPEPWYEIVGVVRDLGMRDGSNPEIRGGGIYQLLEPGAAVPVFAAIHVKGDARGFAPTLRTIATALDPTLRLDQIMPMNELQDSALRGIAFWFVALLLVSGVALLLSLSAIYSVMAFAVARRTREIGIRIALGSDRRRILASIFARPVKQVALGVVAGAGLVALLSYMVLDTLTLRETMIVALYAASMMIVCMIACVVPTRRVLAVQPTEALRADG